MSRRTLLTSGVVALAILVHAPSLSNGFAWDDPDHVVANETLHGLGDIGAVVTSPYLLDRDPRRSPYPPVTSASYALSWAMGGGDPLPFHAFNIVIHGLATLLLLLLLFELGAPAGAAAAGAALFAVHPVHVEAVANVVGRGDVLMTAGALLAALSFVKRGMPAPARWTGVLLGTALAVGAKETGVVVPGLLVLLAVLRPTEGDTSPGGATDVRATGLAASRLRASLPIVGGSLAVVAAYLAARLSVLGVLTTFDRAPYIAALPEGVRVTTAVANLTEVVRLLLVPWELAADYAPAVLEAAPWTSARFAAGVVVLTGAVALAVLSWRRGRRWIALAVLWAAAGHLLVSNLVVEVPIWLAERTLYLPSVGVAFGGVGVVLLWRERVEAEGASALRTAGPAVLAIVLALWSWRSWDRGPTWRTTDTVLATLVEEHPESFRSQWWIAGRLLEAGQTERGLARFREAVAVNPNDAFLVLDYARALILAGRAGEAEEVVRPIPPGLTPTRSVYLAQSLIEQGRLEEARDVVREGLERFPGDERLRGQAEELGVETDSASSGPGGALP